MVANPLVVAKHRPVIHRVLTDPRSFEYRYRNTVCGRIGSDWAGASRAFGKTIFLGGHLCITNDHHLEAMQSFFCISLMVHIYIFSISKFNPTSIRCDGIFRFF